MFFIYFIEGAFGLVVPPSVDVVTSAGLREQVAMGIVGVLAVVSFVGQFFTKEEV